ncbi:hypothetical protein VSR01_04395 [Actinacidiphila sp. DG2A-62]|uniref:putative T7SS-secreted protein n=1 Tax=Actinacidiphila sp. DG2A-62 TaxID=3108821 RepID=UPI002DBEB5BA|nr:hypothetical protein [Actinacidiphila sp. DG2A-62]MEC3992825.1 hypothetical protein [Actinacidiphila sp. DG2A-62]
MSRPTDWDALGLHGDPTPGDPARIRTVAESIGSLGKTARKIDTAMETVLNKTGPETFVGQTAEELRNQISGRLRGFVQSIADAFEWSSGALSTYADAMSDAQSKADAALDQGRGLSQDDPDRDTLAANAKAAGSAQSEAAKTATSTLRKSSGHIKSPVSPCAEFWEIFQWIAIALVIPALIFGGPVALLAIAVNLTLFIKTAVDFAEGKAGILDLFLSALGLIAPSTRALPILSLLTKGANLLKNGIKAASIASLDLFKDMLRGIAKPFVALPSLHDLALATGSWTKAGGLWVMGVGKGLGQLGATIVKSGALFVIKGITGIPGLVKGIGPAVAKFGVNSASWAKAEFGGAKWLRIFLPAEGDEIGEFGVFGATKIAVIDRGVFGKFRFGAVPPATVRPTVQAVGSGVSHIPTPATVHNVNPLVDIPTHDLAATRIQVDQWTNALGPMPLPHAPGAAGFTAPGLLVPNPPALTIGTDFGAPLTFSHQASLRMDALLDIPVGKLSSVTIGDWATITHGADGVTVDAAPAFSKLPEPVAGLFTPPPVHIAVGAEHAGVSGIPNPTIHQLTASIAPPAVIHQATDLVLPPAAVHAAIPVPDAAHIATTTPPAVHVGVDAGATVHISPISHLEVTTATVPTPHLGGLSDSHITATIAHHVAADLGPAATAGAGHAIADITPTPVLAHTADVTPATITATPPPSVVHTVDATTTPVTAAPPPAAPHTADIHAVDVHTTTVSAADVHTVDVHTTSVNAADVHGVDVRSVDVHTTTVNAASVHTVDVRATTAPPHSVDVNVNTTPVAPTHDVTPHTVAAATAPTPGASVPPVATAHYGTHAGTDLPQPAEPVAGLGGKGKAPAAFTAPGGLDLPPAQRLGAAMDLLDHGGLGHFGGSGFQAAPTPVPVHAAPTPQAVHATPVHATPVHATPVHATPAHSEPPRVDPAHVDPAHLDPAHGQPTRVDPATVPPAHVDGAHGQPAAVRPAHVEAANVEAANVEPAHVAAAQALPAAQPPRTRPPRLTGGELDQAWHADSESRAALFGAADDPMRAPRTEAWGRFQLAAHDLRQAEQHVDYLASFPGGPSHGVSPLEHAQVRLGEARQTFADAVRQLREVGVNPVAMDHALRDLMLQSLKERPRLPGGASDVPVITVDGVDGGRLVEVVPLGGGGGVPRGSAVHIAYTRDGVHAHLELPGESAAAPHTVTVLGDGSLRVDHPGAAGAAPGYQVFDPIGDHLWDGHRITTGGIDTGALEFPAPGNGAPARWIGPDGTPVPGHFVVAETDGAGTVTGLKVIQDGTGGEFVRYDPATGAAVGIGAPLRGADGTVHGFAVMPADAIGAGHVEGLAGDLRPGRAMDHLGGGIRVETGGAPGRPAAYTLYDATRTHIGDGRQLLDENGHFFGYAETPPGAHAGTLVDGDWAPVPHQAVRVDLAADGAPATVRVTDTARGDYRTFDPATGALGDHAVMLHGFDDRQLGQFGVTRHPAPAAAGAAPPAPSTSAWTRTATPSPTSPTTAASGGSPAPAAARRRGSTASSAPTAGSPCSGSTSPATAGPSPTGTSTCGRGSAAGSWWTATAPPSPEPAATCCTPAPSTSPTTPGASGWSPSPAAPPWRSSTAGRCPAAAPWTRCAPSTAPASSAGTAASAPGGPRSTAPAPPSTGAPATTAPWTARTGRASTTTCAPCTTSGRAWAAASSLTRTAASGAGCATTSPTASRCRTPPARGPGTGTAAGPTGSATTARARSPSASGDRPTCRRATPCSTRSSPSTRTAPRARSPSPRRAARSDTPCGTPSPRTASPPAPWSNSPAEAACWRSPAGPSSAPRSGCAATR